MYRFKMIEIPDSSNCGLHVQTPMHLIMGCEALVGDRADWNRVLGAASRSFRVLFTPTEYLKNVDVLKIDDEFGN